MPVMYAQTLTIATVRIAPANPEIRKLVAPPSRGRTLINQGIKYVAVTCAIMPARKPKMAITPNTFSLLFIQFTFLVQSTIAHHFSLTNINLYKFHILATVFNSYI